MIRIVEHRLVCTNSRTMTSRLPIFNLGRIICQFMKEKPSMKTPINMSAGSLRYTRRLCKLL